jgi:hypothetical protein
MEEEFDVYIGIETGIDTRISIAFVRAFEGLSVPVWFCPAWHGFDELGSRVSYYLVCLMAS